VAYLAAIGTSSTELDTINTILLQSVALTEPLHFTSIMIVVDQNIYAKVQEIQWAT